MKDRPRECRIAERLAAIYEERFGGHRRVGDSSLFGGAETDGLL
jgi:hypothetical protein